MTRVIHAPNDPLTSFDLRARIFKVDVEFPTYYLAKGYFRTFFLSNGPIFTYGHLNNPTYDQASAERPRS